MSCASRPTTAGTAARGAGRWPCLDRGGFIGMGSIRHRMFAVALASAAWPFVAASTTSDPPTEAAGWTTEAIGLLRESRPDEQVPRARELLLRAAEAGCALAEWMLAQAYRDGSVRLAVAMDGAAADRWLERAAARGYWLAQTELAVQLATGDDATDVELERSRDLMLAAAGRGNAAVQYGVGLMYDNGEGAVEASPAAARQWYARAAAQGHARAQLRLGVHLANGTGGAVDEAEAYFWSVLAAPQDAEAAAFRDRLRPRFDDARAAAIERRAAAWQPQRENPPGEGCMAVF